MIPTPPESPALAKTPPAVLRYSIALAFILYGFAKVMGSQFTILDSELDRPMGEVSGFWLTWYYFGYSTVYGNLLALAQIGGGLLLTFRRTVLLGAAILFAIVTNIVLIDFFYRISLGALLVALLLWAGLLVILSYYREQLRPIFWPDRPAPSVRRSVMRVIAAWTVRVAMVGFAAAFAYWAANVNNRSPTPLDGRWVVESVTGLDPDSIPDRVYFERNRAHMAVFRYAGYDAVHHFEIDPANRSVRVWDEWLRKGAPLFAGSYAADTNRVLLTAISPGDSIGGASLQLVRLP